MFFELMNRFVPSEEDGITKYFGRKTLPAGHELVRISLGTPQEMAYVANELTKMRAEGVF